MSRIDRAFSAARADGRAAFVPYLTAGFPDADGFRSAAGTLLRYADVLEVGLPYSDPLGDGPTIQRSSERALRAGTRTRDVFAMIADLRAEHDTAIVLMTYYNPIYCYGDGGPQGFVRDLVQAGADGLVLPDLPPDEAESLLEIARAAQLDTIFLAAPTSTDARIAKVAAASRGFVYAVSVTGVTGARDRVGDDVPELVRRIRAAGDLPVAVGFGVAGGEAAAQVARVADGVVVGSALVRALDDGADLDALASEIATACRR